MAVDVEVLTGESVAEALDGSVRADHRGQGSLSGSMFKSLLRRFSNLLLGNVPRRGRGSSARCSKAAPRRRERH